MVEISFVEPLPEPYHSLAGFGTAFLILHYISQGKGSELELHHFAFPKPEPHHFGFTEPEPRQNDAVPHHWLKLDEN
jgi:hypothetical protein